MANTAKVNNTKKVPTKHINTNEIKYSSNSYDISNSVKKLQICRIFTKLTYVGVIIGAILYLITIINLFGASIHNTNHWWFGFWIQPINEETATLSAFAIITIIFDCLWLILFTTYIVGNLILNNKIKLIYVTRISIIICISIILMIILGSCCKPIYVVNNNESIFYISWMWLIKNTSGNYSTILTSGAIFILLEMISIYLGCIEYITYYYILRVKKKK